MTNGLTGASQDRTQLSVAAMSDTEDLLAILNEHGQKFLNCFGSTGPQQPKSKKRKLSHTDDVLKPSLRTSSEEESEQDDESEVEWDGFSGASSSSSVRDEEEEDDLLVADRSNASVVVFSDPSSSKRKQREDETSTLKKQFMVCSLVSVRTLFC